MMADFNAKILNALENNELIRDRCDDGRVGGDASWELRVDLDVKDVGKVRMAFFELSDFWALREWWDSSLGHRSKHLFFLFPEDQSKGRFIANHFKEHEKHRSIVFNADV